MGQRILKAGLTALLLTLGFGAAAHAGQYHVYSCRMPDGEVAPTDGWVGSVMEGGAWDQYVENSCKSGGALVAALGDETTHRVSTDRSTWAFEPPAFGRLVGATIWRAGDTAGGGTGNATYQFWLSSPALENLLDYCIASSECPAQGESSQPLSTANRLVVPTSQLGAQLAASVSCGGVKQPEPYVCRAGQGDPSNYAAVIYLYAADLTLEQAAGPSASGAGGELAGAATVAGTSDLTFNASDPGAGVYEAVFTVDGKVVQSTVINENGGRCRNVGQTSDGLPAFLELQPCPASVSADVGFDTTRVANGAHHMVVSVLDAAGNSAPVLDRNVNVDNPAPPGLPNGAGASEQATLTARWRSTPKQTLRAGYGSREMIRGRLTAPGGRPISDAKIDVTQTPSYSGAKTVTMKAPRTDQAGRFDLPVPAGVSSQTIRIAYRAHLGDTSPAASKALKLVVRASLSLAISPRTASAGSTIQFRGRLRGRPIPKDGKALVLEARSGGPWIEFDVIRSSRSGSYHASYTFKFPGPARYQFRVLCEAEADYPYSQGASPVVDVAEH